MVHRVGTIRASSETVKNGSFHRSGCDWLQKRMRLVSEYTKVVATSLSGPLGSGSRRGQTPVKKGCLELIIAPNDRQDVFDSETHT